MLSIAMHLDNFAETILQHVSYQIEWLNIVLKQASLLRVFVFDLGIVIKMLIMSGQIN